MKLRSLQISIITLVILILLSLFSLIIPSINKLGVENNLENILSPPSIGNWLGTDQFGRDILIRSLQGVIVSLGIAIISTFISLSLGLSLSIIAQFTHPLVDQLILFLTNILLSIPSFLLGAIWVLILGNDLYAFTIAMGIGYTPFFTRMLRAQILIIKQKDFIIISKAINASSFYIIKKHIFPLLLPMIIMQGTMSLQGVVLASTSLNFIGLGVSPPTPEWGNMIHDGQIFLNQSLFPFLVPIVIFIITMLSIYRISQYFEYKDLK